MNQPMTLLNSSSKLVNFRCPNYLIKNFDNLVKFKNWNRTSILITLMEKFIREERDEIEKDGNLNDLISDIDNRNKSTFKRELVKIKEGVNKDYEDPISIPSQNDIDRPSVWTTVNSNWEESY